MMRNSQTLEFHNASDYHITSNSKWGALSRENRAERKWRIERILRQERRPNFALTYELWI